MTVEVETAVAAPDASAGLQGRWWPIALEGDARDGPVALQLAGEPLVLWRDAAGQPVLQRDRCPHRGARLSIGWVCEGELQCPYHGWRFAADGACTRVPALPGWQPGASLGLATWPLRAAYGLLWTLVDPAAQVVDEARLPPLAEEGLPRRRVLLGPFDVATSAPRAVENFLDTAHFATVHAGWLGDPAEPQVPHHEVVHTADGRPVVESYRAWQPRASAQAAESRTGAWVVYRYEVLTPYSALLTKQPEPDASGGARGPQDSYVIWACPTDHERCRLWFAQYTTDATTSDEGLMAFQTGIFQQDQPVLESQQPRRLPIGLGSAGGVIPERSTAADRLSLAYRAYLRQQGVRFGVC